MDNNSNLPTPEDDILNLLFTEPSSETETNQDEEIDSPTEETSEVETETEAPEIDEEVSAYFEFLKEHNVLSLPEDFEFDGTDSSLQEALEITKESYLNNAIENIMASLPEDFKPLLAYGLNGGKDVSAYLETFSKRPFEELILDDPDDQKEILKEYYKTFSSYTTEKVNKLIARFEEDELEAEAKDAYKELIAHKAEQKKQFIQRQVEAQKEREKEIEKRAGDLAQAIETSTIEPTRKNKIKGFFFNQVKEDDGRYTNGFNKAIQNILSNPSHQAQLADILLDYTPDKGFDLSRFEARAKTKTSAAYKEFLEKTIQTKLTTKKAPSAAPKKNDMDWEAFINS